MGRSFLLGIVCMGLSSVINAQDLKGSLEKMREAYKQMTNLHIKMLVTVYETKGSGIVDYRLKVDIKKKGNYYLYQYGDNAMLINDQYFIMVDGASSEMACSRRNESTKLSMAKAFNFDMDSIMSFYGEPEYLGREQQVDHYRVEQKVGPVSKLYLSIDTQTKLLKQMAYQYRTGPYVKIDFELFDGSPSFSSATFSEGRFINFKNGKIVVSEPYRNYHLMETVSD